LEVVANPSLPYPGVEYWGFEAWVCTDKEKTICFLNSSNFGIKEIAGTKISPGAVQRKDFLSTKVLTVESVEKVFQGCKGLGTE